MKRNCAIAGLNRTPHEGGWRRPVVKNLPMSWTQKTKLRWPVPLPSTFVIVVAAVSLGCLRPAVAALPCGAEPEVSPAGVADKIKGDADGDANALLQAAPSIDARKLAATQRRELRQKYPQVDKSTLDSYLLWTTCQTISNDPTLAAPQMLAAYAKFYRLLTEPIDKAAPPAE